MSLIREQFDLKIPLPSLLPKQWKTQFESNDNLLFNNLDHFIYTVSKLTQKQDDYCGMSYANALDMLIKNKSDFPKTKQASIRNLVRENLFKRGLITEEVYEEYRYSTDGTQVGVDVGKYCAGESDCVITPAKQYIDFFYELYVSVSYPWNIKNEDVRNNVAKLLATVEELERKHIFIKINTVLPISSVAKSDGGDSVNFFSVIPLFSHKDIKSVETMSAVINDRLLRKFYFAIVEDIYGSKINSGYGYPVTLNKAMNIGHPFNEIEFFETVMKEVGA